jgi:hypothetical protein
VEHVLPDVDPDRCDGRRLMASMAAQGCSSSALVRDQPSKAIALGKQPVHPISGR